MAFSPAGTTDAVPTALYHSRPGQTSAEPGQSAPHAGQPEIGQADGRPVENVWSGPPWQRAMEVLRQAWSDSRHAPVVVSVEGPPGVGKSALLAYFLEEIAPAAGRLNVQSVDAMAPPPGEVGPTTAESVEIAVRRGTGARTPDEPASERRTVRVVAASGASDSTDDWIRSRLLPALGPGGLGLVERQTFDPLPEVAAQPLPIRRLVLDRWEPATAAAYLAHRGMPPTWIPWAVEIGAGSPQLLARMADAVRVDGTMAAAGGVPSMVSFLVERAVHAGSRRMAWRAGYASTSRFDSLLAIAVLLPAFSRPLIAALAGTAVDDNDWHSLQACPILEKRGACGIYKLSFPFRRAAMPLVVEARPWSSRQWFWRAIAYLLDETRSSDAGDLAEQLLAVLIAQMLVGPAPPVALSGKPFWSDRRDRIARLEVHADDGRVLSQAELCVEPGSRQRVRIGRLWSDPTTSGAGELLTGSLLARAMRHGYVVYELQAGIPIPWPDDLFDAGHAFSRRTASSVEITREDVTAWLTRRLFLRRRLTTPMPPTDQVRRALLSLHRPEELADCVASWWPEPARTAPTLVRRWFIDALTAGDWSARPLEQRILVGYYLHRYGPHDALARRLRLPRATYFRLHQRALETLAEHLSGPV